MSEHATEMGTGEPSEAAIRAALEFLPGNIPPTEHEMWQARRALRAAYAVDRPAVTGEEVRLTYWSAFSDAVHGDGSPVKGNDAGWAAVSKLLDTQRPASTGEPSKVLVDLGGLLDLSTDDGAVLFLTRCATSWQFDIGTQKSFQAGVLRVLALRTVRAPELLR